MQIPVHLQPGPGGVFHVSAEYLQTEVKRMEAHPIIWMTHRVVVNEQTDHDEKLHTEFWKECCAMQYSEQLLNKHTSECQNYAFD